MTKRPKAAGDHIESRCTRCKEVTNHIIVAMVEGRVVRVQCNICDGIHNYYPPSTAKPVSTKEAQPRSTSAKAAPREPRAPRNRAAVADAEEWESMVGRGDSESARPYSMERAFKAGELVRHPTFGMGVVKAVLPPAKVEILFQAGRKLLRSGN
ncbi:MAG: hypothetical protein IH614_12175 [Desulfuromonadales bacterium]|nr:hypothetical protein [Desulfuromonadales bacterium]